MPRFFFDAPGTRADLADDTGLNLPDADAACREAFVAVAAMLKDAATRGDDAVALQVRDQGGQSVCRVTAEIRVAKLNCSLVRLPPKAGKP